MPVWDTDFKWTLCYCKSKSTHKGYLSLFVQSLLTKVYWCPFFGQNKFILKFGECKPLPGHNFSTNAYACIHKNSKA